MNVFQSIRVKGPRYNKFNLSHDRKLTLDMGKLIPIYVQEVLPGDKFRVKSECMIRMAPMLAPMMHRVNVRTEYFYVPNRLVWDEWEDFIGGGVDGLAAPVMPNIDTDDIINTGTPDINESGPGSLWDHLGLPWIQISPATSATQVSALPFRAYQLIYNEYYRDQNLEADLDISKASGSVTGAELDKICVIRKRAWEKDRFTSALPFAQRGPSVEIPIEVSGEAPVFINPVNGSTTSATLTATEQPGSVNTGIGVGVDDTLPETPSKVWAVLDSLASSTSINELRRAIKLQEWMEKIARSGARYVELLKAFFGVTSSDARLQRPEYLGGSKAPMRISEVLSSVEFSQEELDPPLQPLGTMGGHGISTSSYNGFKRRFEEHGYVIGLLSVMPVTGYQQGIPKMFRRLDKFDYYWPEFAHLGEEAIQYMELFFDGDASNMPEPITGPFGYTPRYSDYKYAPNTVHGYMKSQFDYWHMNRIFDEQPQLNSDFVISDPTKRIFAVTQEGIDSLWCHVYNKVDAIRPMPYFGTPTL